MPACEWSAIRWRFVDYAMPRADDMCGFDCFNSPVPTKKNPLGVKGAGEAGNVDALSPLGIVQIDMPATPEKVWRAIRKSHETLA